MATTVTLKPNAIDLSGSTSGTTTLQATAVAGTTTITLPAATDTLVGKATTDTLTNKTLTAPTLASANITTALTLTGAAGTNGQALTSGGSGNAPTWTTIAATPGGSTTQVQYNNAGAFAGSDIYYSGTNVGIGTATPETKLHISGGSTTGFTPGLKVQFTNSTNAGCIQLGNDPTGSGTLCGLRIKGDTGGGTTYDTYRNVGGNPSHNFEVNSTERMRIDSSGYVLIAKTASSFSTAGFEYDGANKQLNLTTSGNSSLRINRTTNDGVFVSFQQDASEEGTISVSGTTVSYNGGHLSRYAQTTTAKDESLVKGTVLSNLDAMNVYTAPTTYWTEEEELPEGVNVGDVKVETHEVANEQLNKVKVSDVIGDANVAGVFVNWTYDEAHQVDEINMAMTGDMIIRIAQGVTVQRGDLLMSAGDGTAKAQGDDIVRSKTIAKVTSNHVTCTYADGSYCVPCVLMAC
jgi:hypothetical protein